MKILFVLLALSLTACGKGYSQQQVEAASDNGGAAGEVDPTTTPGYQDGQAVGQIVGVIVDVAAEQVRDMNSKQTEVEQ